MSNDKSLADAIYVNPALVQNLPYLTFLSDIFECLSTVFDQKIVVKAAPFSHEKCMPIESSRAVYIFRTG